MNSIRSFDELQQLLYQWHQEGVAHSRGHTILAVPSLSLPFLDLKSIEQLLHYEERILYLIHVLRNPLNRLVVVTSSAVPETLIAYLLHHLPGIPYSHARSRLTLFALEDGSNCPLSQKMMQRPALMTRLKLLLAKTERSSMSCYQVTELEEELAYRLQVPLHGPKAEHLRLTSNSACRKLFGGLGMPIPDGSGEIRDLADLAQELTGLAQRNPLLDKALIKHNTSICGYGNATVSLSSLRKALSEMSGQAPDNVFYNWLSHNLPDWITPVHEEQARHAFIQRLANEGGVVEEFVEGTACSVEVRIDLDGSVDVIGTHEKLGQGESRQIYSGSRFPAPASIGVALADKGQLLGERLAQEKVVGRFQANFLASRVGDTGQIQLLGTDLHLRKGNTTFPLRTLQFLTGGRYFAQDGLFRDEQNRVRHYFSSDHFGQGHLMGMMPRDLLEILSCTSYHYSSATHTGAVFHMLNGLSQLGQAGITCIADSAESATELYDQVLAELLAQRDNYQWFT